jgi:CRISPR-associated protein Cmr2
MRDYISFKLESNLKQLEELRRQEEIVKNAKGAENMAKRDEAERKAVKIRDALLISVPPAATYMFIDGTGSDALATNLRTLWQERKRKVDCLQELAKDWAQGRDFYRQTFETPRIDLSILPSYSFLVQFTFALAQPYISRDEQNFYIIDNPIRKDKVFGLPYIASTSWKGCLRAAISHLKQADKETIKDENISRLFGNEKGELDQAKFQTGRLFFYPTFFTKKSLEIINPQDRKLRIGTIPIPFESVPKGSEGTFTLLYVPFNSIDTDAENAHKQAAKDLKLVTRGLHAMFRVYGFGAKTSSGFGLAEEIVKSASIEMRMSAIGKVSKPSVRFEQLGEIVESLIEE